MIYFRVNSKDIHEESWHFSNSVWFRNTYFSKRKTSRNRSISFLNTLIGINQNIRVLDASLKNRIGQIERLHPRPPLKSSCMCRLVRQLIKKIYVVTKIAYYTKHQESTESLKWQQVWLAVAILHCPFVSRMCSTLLQYWWYHRLFYHYTIIHLFHYSQYNFYSQYNLDF